MALDLNAIKKKSTEKSADDLAVLDDTPVVSTGSIAPADFYTEESTEASPVSFEKCCCSGVVHNAFNSAVPLPWVSKNDEHALFNMTLEEKYLDAKIFIGAITIRSSFVDRKETMMII